MDGCQLEFGGMVHVQREGWVRVREVSRGLGWWLMDGRKERWGVFRRMLRMGDLDGCAGELIRNVH
jgi:hypothetical protein